MGAYAPDGSSKVTAEYLRKNPRSCRPHVVILGAGASRQAFPEGDSVGIKLPCMNDLISSIGLDDALTACERNDSAGDFEAIYSQLHSSPNNQERLRNIEGRIREYFSRMQLPECATLYDHLLLSLRESDLVATFNWDPLLFDSWERLREQYGLDSLPQLAFLHGNVRVGYCLKDNVFGRIGRICPHCDQTLEPSPLLYPIGIKDYEANPFIAESWRMLRVNLEEAFALTIFGYSAPASDIAAIESMKQSWRRNGERMFETVFIVDIRPEPEIINTWRPFLFSQHFKVHRDYHQSWIPRHARRSVEALLVPTIEGKFVEDAPIPRDAGWPELKTWYSSLLSFEKPST